MSFDVQEGGSEEALNEKQKEIAILHGKLKLLDPSFAARFWMVFGGLGFTTNKFHKINGSYAMLAAEWLKDACDHVESCAMMQKISKKAEVNE